MEYPINISLQGPTKTINKHIFKDTMLAACSCHKREYGSLLYTVLLVSKRTRHLKYLRIHHCKFVLGLAIFPIYYTQRRSCSYIYSNPTEAWWTLQSNTEQCKLRYILREGSIRNLTGYLQDKQSCNVVPLYTSNFKWKPRKKKTLEAKIFLWRAIVQPSKYSFLRLPLRCKSDIKNRMCHHNVLLFKSC